MKKSDKFFLYIFCFWITHAFIHIYSSNCKCLKSIQHVNFNEKRWWYNINVLPYILAIQVCSFSVKNFIVCKCWKSCIKHFPNIFQNSLLFLALLMIILLQCFNKGTYTYEIVYCNFNISHRTSWGILILRTNYK